MDYGTSGFIQGFLQGFQKAGGTQKLSSWAGRNIAGGEYYNPQQDPLYQQELKRARELGTPAARQQFIEKYGGYVDTGKQAPEGYFFQPAEGTPQAMERQAAQYGLEQQRLQTEYMEPQLQQQQKKGELSLKTGREQLGQMRTRGEYLPQQLELGLEEQQLGLKGTRRQLEREEEMFPIRKKAAELALEEQETMLPIKTQLSREELNRVQTQNEYLEEQIQQQLDAGEQNLISQRLSNEAQRLQNQRNRQLMPHELEQLKNQIYAQELQNRGLELDIETKEAIAPYQREQARIQTETAQQNLNQLRTRNQFLERQLQSQLDAQELQNTNQRLQNEIAQASAAQAGELSELKVEQLKRNIYMQKLQEKRMEIQLEYMPQQQQLQLEQMRKALMDTKDISPGFDTIIDTDEAGNPIYMNKQGFQYQLDMNGNVIPYEKEVDTGDQEKGWNLWRGLLPLEGTGWFSGFRGAPQETGQSQQPQTTGEVAPEIKQQNLSIILDDYRNNVYPNLSDEKIAQRIANQDPQELSAANQHFAQFGLSVEEIVSALRG